MPATTDIPLTSILGGLGFTGCCGLDPYVAARLGGANTRLSSKSDPVISSFMDANG
jgi:hypothetical protein